MIVGIAIPMKPQASADPNLGTNSAALPQDVESLDTVILYDKAEDCTPYRAGGYHPIHLGEDIGHHSRYHVIHKLKRGGFPTVWLSRDSEGGGYVAIKTMKAETSSERCFDLVLSSHWNKHFNLRSRAAHPGAEFIAVPQSHFWITGPNGRHLYLVLPVLGPHISEL